MKEQCVNFLRWCNTPMHRDNGVLTWKKRVIPQMPDYDCYLIIDQSGRSALHEGEYLTAEQVYDYWVNN